MGQVIAIGGGGLFEAHERRMHRFLLGRTKQPRPRVCFVATGKGDNPALLDRYYAAFAGHECEASHLGLFERGVRELEPFVLAHDLVLVWGGNTASMLAVWRAHGLDTILRRAHERGVVLAGVCAGALAWFEDGVTDSFAGLDPVGGGLGLVPGSHCPHYDADPQRRAAYHRLVASGELGPGYAADVDVALCFVDGRLAEVVSSRAGAAAWAVGRDADGVHETRVPARLLEPGG